MELKRKQKEKEEFFLENKNVKEETWALEIKDYNMVQRKVYLLKLLDLLKIFKISFMIDSFKIKKTILFKDYLMISLCMDNKLTNKINSDLEEVLNKTIVLLMNLVINLQI